MTEKKICQQNIGQISNKFCNTLSFVFGQMKCIFVKRVHQGVILKPVEEKNMVRRSLMYTRVILSLEITWKH